MEKSNEIFAQELAVAMNEWSNGATNALDATKGIGRMGAIRSEMATLPLSERIAIRVLADEIYLSI